MSGIVLKYAGAGVLHKEAYAFEGLVTSPGELPTSIVPVFGKTHVCRRQALAVTYRSSPRNNEAPARNGWPKLEAKVGSIKIRRTPLHLALYCPPNHLFFSPFPPVISCLQLVPLPRAQFLHGQRRLRLAAADQPPPRPPSFLPSSSLLPAQLGLQLFHPPPLYSHDTPGEQFLSPSSILLLLALRKSRTPAPGCLPRRRLSRRRSLWAGPGTASRVEL